MTDQTEQPKGEEPAPEPAPERPQIQVVQDVDAELEGMSHQDASEIAQGEVELQLPMQTIVLAGCPMRVVRKNDSDERALVVGPIAINFVVPMTPEGARHIARNLTGGVEVASGLPPNLKLPS